MKEYFMKNCFKNEFEGLLKVPNFGFALFFSIIFPSRIAMITKPEI